MLKEEDGYILQKMLIPKLPKRNEAHLKQMSVTLASNFNIRAHKYHTILRNQICGKLSKIFGQPIFSIGDTVFKEIESVHEQLQEKLCL